MDQNNPNPQDPAVPTGGQEPQDPGYKYEDLSGQSIREIADGQPATPAPEEKPQAPETPAETPAPTPPVPTAEEIAKQTADELEKRRKESEAPAEPEPTEDEKKATAKYLEWEATFKAKNNRPPSYWEAQNFVRETVKEELKIELKQDAENERKAEEQRQQEINQKREEEQKRVDSIVDDELQDLYNAGKLTKIQDPNNPSDQGVLERKALFQTWMEVNNARRAKGLPDIISATRIFYGADETGKPYFTKPNAQPAGANAPVQGNKGSATPPSAEGSYTYADLKKPWSFFRRGQ